MTTGEQQAKGRGLEIDAFDSTLHKSKQWVGEVAARLGCDPHRGYVALRAALHALRDRLTVIEAAQLGAQLPMLIRGVYYEGWTPVDKPVKWDKAGFLDAVRTGFHGVSALEPAEVTRAVFAVLQEHITAGEIRDVRAILPEDIEKLVTYGY